MKRLPKILTHSILFADDDHLKEQGHENGDDDKGGGGGGGNVDEDKRKADFFAKFAASKAAPPELGGDKDNAPNLEAAKQMAEESKRKMEREQTREADKKRPGGNLPAILEGKRKAEEERDALKTKVETFEKEKPVLEAKIAEYEQKLAGGELSPAKVKEYEQKIVELETKQREREESLVNESQSLKKRLAFYDLANDPEFKRQYEAPVVQNHSIAIEIIGDDKAKNEALHRALIANGSALRAPNAEARRIAEKERDSIISALIGDMDQFAGGRFATAMTNYIETAKQHAVALGRHEETTAKMREEATSKANAAQAERLQVWGRTFKETGKNYADDEKIDAEDKKLAKELGTDVEAELAKANLMADKVITGQSTMMEAMDFVHRGRVQIVMKAKVAVLEKKLADAMGLVEKLRGGGTRGGESGGPTGTPPKPKAKEGEAVNRSGETREEWQARRFGQNRHNANA